MKKRGNEFLEDDRSKEDFLAAADGVQQLLEDFDAMGLGVCPALGGALTQLLTYLIAVSPDNETAMEMLSCCISNATIHMDTEVITHLSNDQIH